MELFGKKKSAEEWCMEGIALESLSKYDESIITYDKAIKIDPKDSTTWFFKGGALAQLGKKDEVEKCYKISKVLEK